MLNFVEWRQPGVYDVDQASEESAIVDPGESMTQQHLGPDTDINVLVRRYGLSGEMPQRLELAQYGEFDEGMDLQTLLQNVQVGLDVFAQVPADIRGKFDNDPAYFLDWIHDPANYDEAVTLGLVPKRPGAPVAPAGEEVRALEPKPVVVAAEPVVP